MCVWKSETRVVPGAYDDVFRCVLEAARTAAMTVIRDNKYRGDIELSKGTSVFSWGEDIVVRLAPSPGGVEVNIRSSLKFGLIDWGRNGANVNMLFELIDRGLAAPAGAWHADPSGRHEIRWWDGRRWTEHVSDAGTVSLDAP